MWTTSNEVLISSQISGCFRRPLSELITPPSGVEDATAGAAATRLGQSIPNPTSGDVLIPYSLAQGGHVSIALYNSLLQQVATVVDGEQPAGSHTARLDASALPPGAYYYRLHAGTINLTRQMVVVR
ncbi:MAG: T9SS type A sorting domain-containing protein [Nitrospira sp.]|nr:T9SS type A sorting domain-containing protein [Nitrospira sp.]